MTGFDFETPNLELATVVAEVAEDCDPKSSKYSVRINNVFHFFFAPPSNRDARNPAEDYHDQGVETKSVGSSKSGNGISITNHFYLDMAQSFRFRLKSAYPDLDEEEIDKIIEQYRIEEEERLAQNEAEKARLRLAIKEEIDGNPQTGRELAFKLCAGFEDDDAKKLRYQLYDKIPGLSDEQKIQICKDYLATLDPETNKDHIAGIYKRLAEYSAHISETNNTECLQTEITEYLELWCSESTDRLKSANSIIIFCIDHLLEGELEKWVKKYEELCVKQERLDVFSSSLINLTWRMKGTGLTYKTVRSISSDYYTYDLVNALSHSHEYDAAMYAANQITNRKLNNKPILEDGMPYLLWLENLKIGQVSPLLNHYYESNRLAIYIFEYCLSSDPMTNARINQIKTKYLPAFKEHKQHLAFIDSYRIQPHAKRQETLSDYVEACEKDLLVIPQVFAFLKEYMSLLHFQQGEFVYDYPEIFNMPILNINHLHTYANCSMFNRLAIDYERDNKFDDAIRICDAAISFGYVDDGTKMGMAGRKEKLLKKKQRLTKS